MKKIKYSLIIPAYNMEKFIKKSLDSLLKQTFDNWEAIVIDDGSTDTTAAIVSKYIDKRIKYFYQKNQGLSVARNNGIKKATGEYLLFLDSDDYLEPELLAEINKFDSEIIRFQANEVFEDGRIIQWNEETFKNLNGIQAFAKIVEFHYVEMSQLYAYKKSFWVKNKFMFKPGAYHEDFGLIPYVLIKAKNIDSISYKGYNYLQRTGSIMNLLDYEKNVKKAFDMLDQYLIIRKKSSDPCYLSFLANSVILKIRYLRKEEYKKYKNILTKEKVFDDILTDNLKRKLKKMIMRINLKLYIKVSK